MESRIAFGFWVGMAVTGAQAARITLTNSGPVAVNADNAVVRNLRITANGQDGIRVENARNVTIENCKIDFTGDCRGIYFSHAQGLTIKGCDITYANAPAKGPLPTTNRNGIEGEYSDSVLIDSVRVRDPSTGVYLRTCHQATIRWLEGHNIRGDFPRGQLVQWDRSRYGVLEDFSVINDSGVAWTEDNVNCYRSGGQTIRRGLIQGNNSPSGVGVLFEEQGASGSSGVFGGTVEDVDLIGMGDGMCGGSQGARDITFTRIRAKDNLCGDLGQGRGKPTSNALVFSGWGDSVLGPGSGLRFTQVTLYHLCNPSNIYYPSASFTAHDYTVADFTPRAPVALVFPWEAGTTAVRARPARPGRPGSGARTGPFRLTGQRVPEPGAEAGQVLVGYPRGRRIGE